MFAENNIGASIDIGARRLAKLCVCGGGGGGGGDGEDNCN